MGIRLEYGGIKYRYRIDGGETSICFCDGCRLALRSNYADVASVINVEIEDCTDYSLEGRAKVISL